MHFKHINLCANDLNDECRDQVSALLKRTNDEFGLTLAGNPISKATAETFLKAAQDTHVSRVAPDHVDPQMGLRRVAV